MLICVSARAAAYPTKSNEPRARRSLRVLVADDNADTRDMFRIYLETVGLEVGVAADGAAAMRLAKNELPDVIVLDVRMPRVNGRDVARLLRADKATSRIPIIVLSGSVGVGDLEESVPGADAILAKPCLPADLLNVIRRLTGRA